MMVDEHKKLYLKVENDTRTWVFQFDVRGEHIVTIGGGESCDIRLLGAPLLCFHVERRGPRLWLVVDYATGVRVSARNVSKEAVLSTCNPVEFASYCLQLRVGLVAGDGPAQVLDTDEKTTCIVASNDAPRIDHLRTESSKLHQLDHSDRAQTNEQTMAYAAAAVTEVVTEGVYRDFTSFPSETSSVVYSGSNTAAREPLIEESDSFNEETGTAKTLVPLPQRNPIVAHILEHHWRAFILGLAVAMGIGFAVALAERAKTRSKNAIQPAGVLEMKPTLSGPQQESQP